MSSHKKVMLEYSKNIESSPELPPRGSQPNTYEAMLEEFVQLCDQLVNAGFPYLAVILCHELYRFLYPAEPYADYVAKDPLPFVTAHIQRLIAEGQRFAQTVTPYPLDLSTFFSSSIEKGLEHATADMYTSLWKGFDEATLTRQGSELLKRRISPAIVGDHIVGKRVLDLGCGSGRYSIPLALAGAGQVVAMDWQAASFDSARTWCMAHNVPVDYMEGDVLHLPLQPESFDFILCQGVLHHTRSIEEGLLEVRRVLKKTGVAFLYLYAAHGIYWNTRLALRRVFKNIPLAYTQQVLKLIGTPSARFIFCDTWHVPLETHTSREDLETMLERTAFQYQKVIGQGPFDLDKAIEDTIPNARTMWGDGEHRYLLRRRD